MNISESGKQQKAEYAGIEVGVDTVFDEFHFTLQDNGKVKLNVNGDETTGKWDETENGISIEDEMEFQKLDDNTLTYEVSGVTVHLPEINQETKYAESILE